MDRFLKRRAESTANGSKGAKKLKNSVEWGKKSPRTIVAWNCNGLTARVRAGDMEEFKKFVEEVKPDVIFLSEVRIAAANNAAGRKPGPYTKWTRNQMKDNDKRSGEDVAGVRALLRCNELSPYVTFFSLANTKYAGTALWIRKESVMKPISIRYNLEDSATVPSVHDPDGRVILMEFPDFSILHTYVPNNGWGESHFARRKAWDEKILALAKREHLAEKPLIWVGDLNVAPEDEDLSNPAVYRKAVGEELRNKAKETGEPIEQCNIGQPGCTDAERSRFQNILEGGGLVDVFRKLHGYPEDKEYAFSWRGTVIGKHGGSGMRIDHCIASSSLLTRILSVKITGHGAQRLGFMGSDHSPLLIQMSEPSSLTRE